MILLPSGCSTPCSHSDRTWQVTQVFAVKPRKLKQNHEAAPVHVDAPERVYGAERNRSRVRLWLAAEVWSASGKSLFMNCDFCREDVEKGQWGLLCDLRQNPSATQTRGGRWGSHPLGQEAFLILPHSCFLQLHDVLQFLRVWETRVFLLLYKIDAERRDLPLIFWNLPDRQPTEDNWLSTCSLKCEIISPFWIVAYDCSYILLCFHLFLIFCLIIHWINNIQQRKSKIRIWIFMSFCLKTDFLPTYFWLYINHCRLSSSEKCLVFVNI